MRVYEFTGEPGLVVNVPIKLVQFKFTDSGKLLISEDNPVLQRMMARFAYEEVGVEESKTFPCKQCGFVATSRPELMRHYRENHPKEKE